MRVGIGCVVLLGLWVPSSASALSYSEATSGDIPSFDENAPTPLGAVELGANVVTGSVSLELELGDVFSVDVPAGLEITDITLEISDLSGGFSAAVKLFATPVFQTLDFGARSGDGLYPSVVTPLPGDASYGSQRPSSAAP